MRPVVRDIWVSALRTGAYAQGFDSLLRSEDDKFCPLGVLCDLASLVGIVAWDKIDGRWFIPPLTTSGVSGPVMDWAGFKGMHPSQLVPLTFGGVKHPIWRLNDTFKLSFDAIADLIEEQYA